MAIIAALHPLIGRKLSITFNAGNMKGIHFGELRRLPDGRLVGEYALHIQCPWRLEHDGRVITGSLDYYVRADNNSDENWEPGTVSGHLQDQILSELLGGDDETSRSNANQTQHFIATEITSDSFGGCQIELSGNYRLALFPCASRNEAWRLLEPGVNKEHFFIEAGKALLE